MKLQVFVHGVDIVEDILHYPGDDAHSICVMEIPLWWRRHECNTKDMTLTCKRSFGISLYLHGVCFSRRRLSIGKNSAVVSLQNILEAPASTESEGLVGLK